MSRQLKSRVHTGFTLVELIVVVTLILFLAGLTARFLPSATTSAREANAAAQVQNWLNMAKQRALRDQAPRGIRLWNKNGDLRIVECEFTELPDPYTSDLVITNPADPTLMSLIFEGTSIANGYVGNQNLWLVQPGDYISINGGQMHSLATAPFVLAGKIHWKVNSPLVTPVPSPGTANYYILRAPRPVGDETLQLPADEPGPANMRAVIIDLNTNSSNPAVTTSTTPFTNAATGLPWNNLAGVASGTPFVDIMFTPSGTTMVFVGGTPTAAQSTPITVPTGILHLWVRTVDPSNDDPAKGLNNDYFVGDPTLVSIRLNTGFVGASSPSSQFTTQGNNPYYYVQY